MTSKCLDSSEDLDCFLTHIFFKSCLMDYFGDMHVLSRCDELLVTKSKATVGCVL